MKEYKTVQKEAKAEQIIEKSRFITHVKPVESKEEADKYIDEIKKKYKDATHNVPAMVIGDAMQIQWGSDDGEPQGTSGAPIVQMIVNEGLTNIVIIVTRYFGGVKLGTGGLVRAYTSSAKLGIEKSGICTIKPMLIIDYEIDYSHLAPIQKCAQQEGFTVENIKYEENVTLSLVIDRGDEEKLIQSLANITGGKGKVINKEIQSRKSKQCKD